MPTLVDGKPHAVLSDYLTTELPDETWQRWPYTHAWGMLLTQSTYPFWTRAGWRQAYGATEPPNARDEPWINEVYGASYQSTSIDKWINEDWHASDVFYWPENYSVTSIEALKSAAAARIQQYAGGLAVPWTDSSWQWGPAAYSTLPESDMHYLDIGTDDGTPVIDAAVQTRTDGWRKNPAGADGTAAIASARAAIAAGIEAHEWRMVIPQPTKPQVLPLAAMPQQHWSAVVAHSTVQDHHVLRLVSVGGLRIPRTGNICAWTKLLHETNLQANIDLTRAWHPTVQIHQTGDNMHVQLRCVPASAAIYLHFAAVDGATSPTSRAEAQTMLGVDADVNWATMGIPGLTPAAFTEFAWPGRNATYLEHPTWAYKPLRLTAVVTPAGFTPGTYPALDDLLAVDGVKMAAQWELWPESAVGPSIPYNIPVELLHADMSLQTGVRLALGGQAPIGGYDGGEIL